MLPNFYRYVTGALTLQAALGNPIAHPHYPYGTPPALEANHLGAVASESEICSHIGIELLKKGGNAADALVGTVFCVGVVGMYHSGMFEYFSFHCYKEKYPSLGSCMFLWNYFLLSCISTMVIFWIARSSERCLNFPYSISIPSLASDND
jgi:hypothetical protein